MYKNVFQARCLFRAKRFAWPSIFLNYFMSALTSSTKQQNCVHLLRAGARWFPPPSLNFGPPNQYTIYCIHGRPQGGRTGICPPWKFGLRSKNLLKT